MSSSVMARGVCQPGPNGSAEGAMVGQGSSPGRQRLGAFPGPLRGGLAAGMRELDAEFRRADALAMGDDARQRVLAVVRIKPEAAMGDAADAFDMGRLEHSKPAPEFASMPRWVMCQSLPTPSLALYWHIGATTMRFANVRSASFIGENKALGMACSHAWTDWGRMMGFDGSVRQALGVTPCRTQWRRARG